MNDKSLSHEDKEAQEPREGIDSPANEAPAGVPQEIFDQLPREARAIMTMGFSSRGVNPLLDKVNDGHIDRIIDEIAKDNERQYNYAAAINWFRFGIFLIAIVVVLFILVFFRDKPAILAPVLTAILGFAAGFGVGKNS